MNRCSLHFFFYCYGINRDLHSFPTRRSSDLMVAPEMRERRDGSIIFTISIGALKASTVIAMYGVTKAADFALCRSLAAEWRSEEHTSELQSRRDLVCRLLLEKKKTRQHTLTT